MIVAFRTHERLPEPRRANALDPVDQILRFILLRLRSPFLRRKDEPVVGTGHQLLGRTLRQQIARNLLDRELIKGFIGIERPDHVVPEGRYRHRIVAVIPNRIGVTHLIEPPDRHAFPVGRRRHEAVDHSFIGIGGLIRDKGGDFRRARRQTREVIRNAAGQRDPIRFGSWSDLKRLQSGADEAVDGIPLRRVALGNGGTVRRDIGPVVFVFGP